MESDIKKEASELVTHGPQTALRISESTPIEVSRQAGSPKNYTNSYLDSNFWPEGQLHPYYQVSENLEYAVFDLKMATTKRAKKSCIKSLEEVWGCLKRAIILLAADARVAALQASIRAALHEVTYVLDHEHELVLEDLKGSAEWAIPILGDVLAKIPDLIVADEDARYPGCRNEEGELIVPESAERGVN